MKLLTKKLVNEKMINFIKLKMKYNSCFNCLSYFLRMYERVKKKLISTSQNYAYRQ